MGLYFCSEGFLGRFSFCLLKKGRGYVSARQQDLRLRDLRFKQAYYRTVISSNLGDFRGDCFRNYIDFTATIDILDILI